MGRYLDLGFVKIDTEKFLDTMLAVGLLYSTFKLGELSGSMDTGREDLSATSKSKDEVELEVKN